MQGYGRYTIWNKVDCNFISHDHQKNDHNNKDNSDINNVDLKNQTERCKATDSDIRPKITSMILHRSEHVSIIGDLNLDPNENQLLELGPSSSPSTKLSQLEQPT